MKASEMIRQLQQAVEKFGDMDILVRLPADGCGWSDLTIFPDPPSPWEKEIQVEGTIDICVVEEDGKETLPKLCQDTPLGTLVAEASEDPHHPGIWVSLRRPDRDYDLTLALVEFTSDDVDADMLCDGGLVTRVWGDGSQEDYTTRVFHSGVEEYFAERMEAT